MSEPKSGPAAYPNLENAIGTSIPVVTTVLAAIGTTTYVVPLQDAAAGNEDRSAAVALPSAGGNSWDIRYEMFRGRDSGDNSCTRDSLRCTPARPPTELLTSTTAEDEKPVVKDHYRDQATL